MLHFAYASTHSHDCGGTLKEKPCIGRHTRTRSKRTAQCCSRLYEMLRSPIRFRQLHNRRSSHASVNCWAGPRDKRQYFCRAIHHNSSFFFNANSTRPLESGQMRVTNEGIAEIGAKSEQCSPLDPRTNDAPITLRCARDQAFYI